WLIQLLQRLLDRRLGFPESHSALFGRLLCEWECKHVEVIQTPPSYKLTHTHTHTTTPVQICTQLCLCARHASTHIHPQVCKHKPVITHTHTLTHTQHSLAVRA